VVVRSNAIVGFLVIIAITSIATGSRRVAAQELQPVLTMAAAKAIVVGCEAYAQKHELLIVIAVMGPGKSLAAFSRMDRALPGAGEVAIWKATSSAIFGLPSKDFAELAKTNPSLALTPGIATLEGGEAIYTQQGQLIGGVGVSGAPAEDDAACARAGISHAGLRHKK
jgi:uncharacterized protein GlcG (DUF336 family)